MAALIEPGTHFIGQAYGGGGRDARGRARPREVASLTVSEPPAFALARGNPEVEATIARLMPVFAERLEPGAFLLRFVAAVGSSYRPPDPLPPDVEASIRAHMAERPPWEARSPLDEIRAAGIPCLVISGGHSAAFEAVCDAQKSSSVTGPTVRQPGAGG